MYIYIRQMEVKKMIFAIFLKKSWKIKNVLLFLLIIAYPNGHPRDISANFTKNTKFGIVKTTSSAPRELDYEKLEM